MNNIETPSGPHREVPVDWEALEDAFENNAPEVHSYLHLVTGEVLRVVDGVADPQMHVRIASDTNYLRVDPVSSREQYRWMERFIPMAEDVELREKLTRAIDGKGAFRRFKDVLMSYAPDRERWFTFRSERLRTFIEAWLSAHAIQAIPRPAWEPEPESAADAMGAGPGSAGPDSAGPESAGPSSASVDAEGPKSSSLGRTRTTEVARERLRDLAVGLGLRDLDGLVSYAEFLKTRRAARGFAHHYDHHQEDHRQEDHRQERDAEAPASAAVPDPTPKEA